MPGMPTCRGTQADLKSVKSTHQLAVLSPRDFGAKSKAYSSALVDGVRMDRCNLHVVRSDGMAKAHEEMVPVEEPSVKTFET